METEMEIETRRKRANRRFQERKGFIHARGQV